MKKSIALLLFAAACGGTSDADYQQDVVAGMHDSIEVDLQHLVDAAKALQAAAPDHAWDATTDAAAIAAMTEAWRAARTGYEHVEGATAPIFPAEDVSMDERYDGFLAALGPTGDQDLFDDHGVTGMHAIERILFAPTTRQEVIDFEAMLPGYQAAAWPATAQEASDFKAKLCQKLIDDAQQLHDEWTPSNIDAGAAFQGLIGLMNEQKEKVNLAATGEEESRYANWTLFDLRTNLAGTTAIYDLFQPWVRSKGGDVDDQLQVGFADLAALYGAASGDALPPVPATWSSDAPSAADLATPFGTMWKGVHEAVDPTRDGSIVFEMNQAAVELGFPQFEP
ncbi:MAG TPA: imelysin family protein [Kofleriaceae bacterium]|nr:imelysin family protein [Kofleriaceae bacterium]